MISTHSPLTQDLMALAYAEDLGLGDITTDALPHLERVISAPLVSRTDGVFSGLEYAQQWVDTVNAHVSSTSTFTPLTLQLSVAVGSSFKTGQTLITIMGSVGLVLKAERVLLNGVQHLCGVATLTRQLAQAIEHTPCRVAHTRKTLAGWRVFEQQAVVDGGGVKHRFNLGTAVMIKDNHVTAMGGSLSGVIQAVKAYNGHTVCIEAEVDTLEQLAVVLDEGVDVVLLDNMTPEQIRQAVVIINRYDNKPMIEVSGGITLDTAVQYAEAGAQIMSTSQITMGALPLDIGLDF